ncbi:actin-6-like [Discoglossus pictus]
MNKIPVVIDTGSGFCRCGFATDDQPSSIIRSVVVIPFYHKKKQDGFHQDSSITDLFTMERVKLIKNGIITNWEAMELFWNHVFSCRLNVLPEDQVAYMSDSPSNPATNREKMAEVLFESFDVPGLQISNTSFLSLCSTGALSGIVIESGYTVSHTVAIFEGQTIKNGTYRLDIAGKRLTKHLAQLLLKDNRIPFSLEKKQLMQLKEKYCYLSLDYERDMAMDDEQQICKLELPDGKVFTLGKEKFQCPEPLFKPSMLGNDSPGLHTLAFKSIENVPPSCRNDILSNVTLAGASSLLHGFPERIRDELVRLCPLGYQLKFIARPGRENAAWTGGAITATISSSNIMVMRKEDYKEHGAYYVHKKFI